MQEIDILWENTEPQPWEQAYFEYITAILKVAGAREWAVSVTLTDDNMIRELNRDFRGKDEATDVLSFVESPQDRPDLLEKNGIILGDLVISLDTLKENAAYFGVSENEEFKRITLHGILHLQGWDHATNDPAEPMLQLQEKILGNYSGVKIIK